MRLLKLILITLLLSTLAGCATPLPPANFSKSELTQYQPQPSAIIVQRNTAIGKRNNLLVVGFESFININTSTTAQQFWVSALRNLGFFKHVLPASAVPAFLRSQGITPAPAGYQSPFSLHQLAQRYPNFLIAIISSDCSNITLLCTINFKVYNPVNMRELFVMKHNGALTNLKQRYYPILSGFNQWLNNNR